MKELSIGKLRLWQQRQSHLKCQHPLPSKPREHLATDLLGPLPSGEQLLVLVDYYSRVVNVDQVVRRHTFTTVVAAVNSFVSSLFLSRWGQRTGVVHFTGRSHPSSTSTQQRWQRPTLPIVLEAASPEQRLFQAMFFPHFHNAESTLVRLRSCPASSAADLVKMSSLLFLCVVPKFNFKWLPHPQMSSPSNNPCQARLFAISSRNIRYLHG